MKINKKMLKALNLTSDKAFKSFWKRTCKGKDTIEQIEKVFNYNKEYSKVIIDDILDEESTIEWIFTLAKTNIKYFLTQYPNDKILLQILENINNKKITNDIVKISNEVFYSIDSSDAKNRFLSLGIILFKQSFRERITEEEKVFDKSNVFISKIIMLCKKYNLSISHQDEHGAFIIEKYDDSYTEWFKQADIKLN